MGEHGDSRGQVGTVATSPVLSVHGLSKSFTGKLVLRDMAFELRPGELRALVGQNGSGKSTFIKVLCGYHQPDAGAVATVAGDPFTLGSSDASFEAGLRFVHQDLGLVSELNAVDNIALGRGYRRRALGTIAWRHEKAWAEAMLGSLGYEFDVESPVGDLTPAQRTGIAIARATEDCEQDLVRVLILDEPTATLPGPEVDHLFEVIRHINERGVAVIYVSHRFAEVFDLCQSVTVLKDGEVVTTTDTGQLDVASLIELTLGREIASFERSISHTSSARQSTPVMSVHSLRGRILDGIDLDLHAGEILGVAGVTGSGREEIGELLFGAAPREGSVEIEGAQLKPARPALSYQTGMAFVPADRLGKAVLADMTLRENLTISHLSDCYGLAGLRRTAERDDVLDWLQRFEVVPQDAEAPIISLSGGNQQKVVMARTMRAKPRVLILDEPTQGVDVGAKAAIHQIVKDATAAGTAVLAISTDSDELLALCDRVLVLVQGRSVGLYDAADLTSDGLSELIIREDLAV
jgi:ribose transport system ATP-binding protein